MAKIKENPKYSVILDTSFMIRLLNETDRLHSNVKGYFQYFLENNNPMYFSTVSIAEYCVRGDFYDLPFQNIRVLPFNIFHAKKAGYFAEILFNAKSKGMIDIPDRLIIPNDSKIFAQGVIESDIKYFVTADVKSKRNIDILREKCSAEIEHMDITIPHTSMFGLIDFDQ